MAKANPLTSSFIGEIGPRLIGNTSFESYPNASETAENLIALTQGGFSRRPGTRFIKEVKDSDNETYLIDFEYSADDSYIIEAGDNYFRFYKDQGNIVVSDTDASITNGTFDSDVTGWTDQSGAGSSISHDSTNNQMLVTSNGTTDGYAWQGVSVGASYQSTVHVLRFRVTGVPGDFINLQIGTTSTGAEIKSEDYGVGYHTVSFTPGAGTIYVQFINSRGKSIGIDDVSIIDDSPLEIATPFTAAQILSSSRPQANDVLYLFAGGTAATHKLLRYGDNDWSIEEVEFLDGPYLDQNIDNVLPSNSTVGLGQKRSQAAASSTTMILSAVTGLGVTLTASSTEGVNGGQGFLSTDVGRLIRIQKASETTIPSTVDTGYGIITAVASTTSATVDVRRDFNADVAVTASTVWWLGAFSQTTGYPASGVFHNQRLWCGSTNNSPFSLFASQSGDIENMRPDSFVDVSGTDTMTVEDDDALNITLAATKSNKIIWIQSSDDLLVGTAGGEWQISPSSNGSVITPTDVNAVQGSRIGSSNIQPIQADDSVIFIQRGNRKAYDFSFSFDVDGFKGRDLTVLAHRSIDSGVTQIAYAPEPDSAIYFVRTDGQIGVCSYRPVENRVSWTRFKLGGSFSTGDAVAESVAVIQGEDGGGRTLDSGDRSEVWVIVKRTINSTTKRFVEVFEGHFNGPVKHDYSTDALWEAQLLTEQKDLIYSDSALTYDGSATDTITGLDHLEGETVKVLADGGVHPDETVSSGSITLDYEASKVQVGLGYHHTYKSAKLDYGGTAGTAIGKVKRINRITFILLDTASFQFGKSLDSLTNVEFRKSDDAMDTAVPLFCGEARKDFSSGYNTDTRILIKSDTPLPFNLLAIAPELKTNDVR